MKMFMNDEQIHVSGVCFDGVRDMICHAQKGKDKDGIFVGIDAKSYPCFDCYDAAYEDREYTNLVFARSREELEEKMRRIKSMAPLGSNYNKLTETLHPMAYWGGDTHHKLYMTEGTD